MAADGAAQQSERDVLRPLDEPVAPRVNLITLIAFGSALAVDFAVMGLFTRDWPPSDLLILFAASVGWVAVSVSCYVLAYVHHRRKQWRRLGRTILRLDEKPVRAPGEQARRVFFNTFLFYGMTIMLGYHFVVESRKEHRAFDIAFNIYILFCFLVVAVISGVHYLRARKLVICERGFRYSILWRTWDEVKSTRWPKLCPNSVLFEDYRDTGIENGPLIAIPEHRVAQVDRVLGRILQERHTPRAETSAAESEP